MSKFTFYKKPKLNSPYLVAGFDGWPDAGKVSSGAVRYLRNKLNARKFAEIDPNDFYIFQSPGVELLRPTTVIEDGQVKDLSLPSTGFWAWNNKESTGHDLILVLGVEPHLRWNEYADVFLNLAQELSVQRIYTIGGTYDRVPHTMEPIISAVSNDQALEAELRKYNIEPTSYHGPSSVHSLLLYSATKRNLKSASIWGHAPHYIQTPNSKVCYSILIRLTAMLEMAIDLDDIKQEGEELDEQINMAVAQKPELAEYVKKLEEEYRLADTHEAAGPEEIIREVEDFLRDKKDSEE